jgi:pimeloyl-ACP methyl ester carboxylesterase
MADPTLNFVSCPDNTGGHRMAYWQWGDAGATHTIVCVHGLSRQGRDFDVLARALVARAPGPLRVVCPDVAGRGESDWLTDPQAYAVPGYAADMLALLAVLKPQTLDWVGTSMGGLIGLAVCAHAQAAGATVRRLVLNDVGPVLEWQSLLRIGAYLGKHMHFDSLHQAADALRVIASSFGPHTPEQWLELSRHMVKPDLAGGVRLHYDPAIALAFESVTQEAAAQGEAALWGLYDAITAQTLLLRGADSDLLSQQTAEQMTRRGPKARLVEFAGVGHAPTLVAETQVDTVASFLLG